MVQRRGVEARDCQLCLLVAGWIWQFNLPLRPRLPTWAGSHCPVAQERREGERNPGPHRCHTSLPALPGLTSHHRLTLRSRKDIHFSIPDQGTDSQAGAVNWPYSQFLVFPESTACWLVIYSEFLITDQQLPLSLLLPLTSLSAACAEGWGTLFA